MLIENIKLSPNRILVQPTTEATSSFSTEQRRYDRKSVGIVKAVSHYVAQIKVGSKVVFDDSHSIDFSLDGVGLCIIRPEDIVAYIEEDK